MRYLVLKSQMLCRFATSSRFATLCAIMLILIPAVTFGQRANRRNLRGNIVPRPAILERNAPIESLLRKASGAIEREDWKLAIDSLQRILDDSGGALLSTDENASDLDIGLTLFESAQDRATSLLASMPPKGIDAYRLLYDGRAKALYERGVKDCNETALRTILARYMVSSYGDDAANVVAGWLLDRNRAAEALELLDRIDQLTVATDVPPAQLAVKHAVAWTMLHDEQRASEALAVAEESDDNGDSFDQEALEAFVQSPWPQYSATSASAGHESWTMHGGDLARRFEMPAVTPELEGNLPWRFVMPADHEHPSWWEAFWESSETLQSAIPVGGYAVSDGRLFVKNLQQVVALDLESLDPLWVSDRPITIDGEQRRKTQFRRQRWSNRLELVDSSYPLEEQILRDHVNGLLSTSFNKVYAIERDGVGESPNRPLKQKMFSFTSFPVYRGTRLIAYDVEHGEIVWQRGRSNDPDDPLGDVQFLSAPITIRDALWVIYAKRTDLYLGILSPDTGKLLQNLLLCTVDPAQLQKRQHMAIYPTSDGSNVFVATGFGIVISVGIEPLALRWAAQYQQDSAFDVPRNGGHWQCEPPVLIGGLLLVAPPDSEMLMALDRATGKLEWTLGQPESAKYILGVDGKRMWLGGEQLYCVNLQDGLVEWESDASNFRYTGRGVLSGDRVFIPTVDGLAQFAAQSGKKLETLPFGDQPPLGNILCIANSTISFDPNEVRKFPDLTLSYPSALAFYEQDPTDRHAAIRLAWMELRRGFPRKAYNVLEKVKPPSRGRSNRVSDVTNLRFEALLAIATLPETDTEDAIEKLREAVGLAEGGQASLRATIALAFRLRDAGHTDEAYLSLWRLGLTPSGDGYVTIEPRLRNKVRLIIGDILSRFERDLSTNQLRNIAEFTQQHAQASIAELEIPATRAAARMNLEQLAQMNDVGGAGQSALVALARFERERGKLEFAEQFALRAIKVDRVAHQTAVAIRDLAEQYLQPDQQLHFDALQLVSRLESEFIRHTIPGTDGSTVSVSEEAMRLKGAIDKALVTDGAFVSNAESFRWKTPLVSVNQGRLGHGMFSYSTDASASFVDHLLFLNNGRWLDAINRDDGQLDWRCELRLPGSVRTDEETNDTEPSHPRLACQKQIAVINGEEGLFGIGIRTGRRLWGIAYEDSGRTQGLAIRDRLVDVADGMLVTARRRGALTCSSLMDIDDIRWERVLNRAKIDSVFVRDGLCMTLDNKRRNVTTYNLKTGRLLSSVEFRKSENEKSFIPVIYENGHLIGAEGAKTVACYSARSGELNWRYETPEEVRWLFKPGDGYIGISCFGSRVILIDALSADVRTDMEIPKDTKGYAEGVLADDRLVLMAITEQSKGDASHLYGIDAESGQVIWKREDLGAIGLNRHALWQQLTLARNVMPVLQRVEVDTENRFLQERGELAIELIDKRSGETIGEMIRARMPLTKRNELTGEFGLWPGQFILGANHGLLSIPLTDEVGSTNETEVWP